MKTRILIVTIVSVLMIAGSAFAGQFGAPEPMLNKRGFSLGMGYFYSLNKWEQEDNTTDAFFKVRQNQIYAQLTGSMEYAEGYFRLGGISVDAEEEDGLDRDFDDNGGVFWTLGGKGFCPLGDYFGIGPFVQFSMYDEFTDSVSGVPLKIEKGAWDFNVGFAFQGGIDPIVIYAGPYFYLARASIDEIGGVADEIDFETKSKFGGMGGLRLNITKAVSLEAEAQYTSKLSYGGLVSINF